MRKFLLSLTVLAGAAAASHGANAAAEPVPVLDAVSRGGAQVQTVQYYGDWRRREWRRHERYEHWRHHQAWRYSHHRRYSGW